ncbi:hypothetical protein [Microbacterium sp. T32]|nr:hypothetical protein [Microbacterium sp. T32]
MSALRPDDDPRLPSLIIASRFALAIVLTLGALWTFAAISKVALP